MSAFAHADWFLVENADAISSPSLLVYPDRIAQNIRAMLARVKNPDLLRPHIKTHKMKEVVTLCLEQGIERFKCATIAEAELLGICQVPDALIAYALVGPNQERLGALRQKFPGTEFSVLVDDLIQARQLSRRFENFPLNVWIDVDVGMGRSGIALEEVPPFVHKVQELPGLRLQGLHAYDGHIHNGTAAERRQVYENCFKPVHRFLVDCKAARWRLVGGGTPTFAMHAQDGLAECSPGTPVLWDFGYQDRYPELGFVVAATLLTRVIGKPGKNRLCLDLGYKAVASESPHPRVRFPQLDDATAVVHSEEHLVVETMAASRFQVGDVVYGIPRHICPTCALFNESVVIENRRAAGTWTIAARGRTITV